MTHDELKLVLEALEKCRTYHQQDWSSEETTKPEVKQAITAIKEALAQPEQDSTYTYASSLATAIWQKHYMKESPKWKPLDTTEGVLTQIDNMTCGLIKEKPAQPEQEPVAYLCENAVGHKYFRWKKPPSTYKPIALYTTPPQRTWVGLTDENLRKLADEHLFYQPEGYEVSGVFAFARAIEAKLKQKNGYAEEKNT